LYSTSHMNESVKNGIKINTYFSQLIHRLIKIWD
jgi:hypothetical protein